MFNISTHQLFYKFYCNWSGNHILEWRTSYETPIFAWKWNKGQIQIDPISALESPHSLKAHVRLRLWISGTKQCSWDLCLYSVGKMIRRTTRRWTSQIFLRTIHLEITNNNDAIWNQNHDIFLKQVYILQEMSPWHYTRTLLTEESGTGNLDLIFSESLEHHHDDVTTNIHIQFRPLIFFK